MVKKRKEETMRSTCTAHLFVTLLTIVVALGLFSPPVQAQQEGYYIVEIEVSGQQQVQQIADLGIDIWEVRAGKVVAYVSPADRVKLQEAGLPFTIKVKDVKGYLQQLTAAQGPSALDYHTYATLQSDLYALESSGVAKVYVIGHSIENRDILAVKISDNPELEEGEPAVLFPGCHHAREWISVEVPYYIAKYLVDNYTTDPSVKALVDNGEIWVIPMVNPDGHQYSVTTDRLWRKNRRFNNPSYGVDLNRNYATGFGGPGSSGNPYDETYRGTAAFSEPETQAIRDLFLDPSIDFKAMITYHSYSQLVLYPWGYTYANAPDHYRLSYFAKQIKDRILAVHGVEYTDQKSSALYLASGTTDDWTYDVERIPSFTIELRPASDIPGFLLPPDQIQPTSEENIPAALYLVALSQNDSDSDGIVDISDNCIEAYNPGQEDADGDGFGAACDCNDSNAAVNPGAYENCSNGVDDDCNGLADSQDPECSSSGWALARSASASTPFALKEGGVKNHTALNILVCLGVPGFLVVGLKIGLRRRNRKARRT